jgi:uncharacterized alpha-E superfamily protein
MLSRVAESIYWMSRYIERAENVARFVDVNIGLSLDSSMPMEQQWSALINTTGDYEAFTKLYGEPTAGNVMAFLTFDRRNPNSILSCLVSARENARSVREIISSAMWLQANRFYLMVRDMAQEPLDLDSAQGVFNQIKEQSHLFCGITDATMTHGEAWHFGRLARMLERADKTSRILDVKYFLLLRSVADVGTAFDDIQWAAVLRSASAFEMYRKRRGRISPEGIVQFLLLDNEFPRAVLFCLDEVRHSLHAISGTPLGTFRTKPEKLLGQICSDLAYNNIEEIVHSGVHEYIDDLQVNLNNIGSGVHDTFFALKAPKPSERFAAHQATP